MGHGTSSESCKRPRGRTGDVQRLENADTDRLANDEAGSDCPEKELNPP